MSYTVAMVDALKQELRTRGLTYADLAKAMDMSEASVKRMFSQRALTLQRVDDIMKFAHIEMADLVRYMGDETRLITQLTYEQESELVENTKLLLVAACLINSFPPEYILDTFEIEKSELMQLLARLDKIGIIQLLPNNRVKLLVARTFRWIPHGPLHQSLRMRIAPDFLSSEFSKEFEHLSFINLTLSKASTANLISRLKQLAKEFSAVHQEDSKLPVEFKRPVSALLAVRPWITNDFAQYLRIKPGHKEASKVIGEVSNSSEKNLGKSNGRTGSKR